MVVGVRKGHVRGDLGVGGLVVVKGQGLLWVVCLSAGNGQNTQYLSVG